MHTLMTTLLLSVVLLGHAQAAEIDNGNADNWVLGSSGTMDSDFIFNFCPTGSPNCLPSPVTMTSARVRVSAQNLITNLDVNLSVIGPVSFANIACSGPSAAGPAGADFSCLFPTALTETKGLFSLSIYVFNATVDYTGFPTGLQNAQLRFFVQTSDAAPTPEPASMMLVAAALAVCMARLRKPA